MKTVSVGMMRVDGDFTILATLNNNDEYLTDYAFDAMVSVVCAAFQLYAETEITVLVRQDAPDYVSLEAEGEEA
jgi:hypothetical protein